MRTVVGWCLRNRAVVFVAAALVVLAGVFGASQLRQQYFPDADLPFLVVNVDAPGLDTRQVDEDIAVPVEQATQGVSDVEQTQTISNQGTLTMLAELSYGTDTDEAREDVQAALDELALPPSAEPPTIEGGFTDQAILTVALSTDGSLFRLTEDAEDLQEDLEGVSGVESVEVEGGARRLLEVELKPGAVRDGLTPGAVADTLGQATQGQPVGLVEDGGSSTPLRILPEDVDTAERLRDVALGDGRTLDEVATVRETTDLPAGFARTNGRRSVSLSVFKEEDADEVAVIEEAQGVLASASGELDAKVTTIFQTATEVRQSISGLVLEGGLGVLFAVAVIFLFLRSPRATLVAAVAIPTSVVFGLLAAWLLGLTVNIITLAGLTIAVGRVIDDAIVVLENIYKHLERGEPPARAAVDGTSEVATAVASSTLAAVAVFVPLGLVGGLVSEIFLSFSIIVAVALLASLLVSVTLVPVLAVTVLRPRAAAAGGERLAAAIGSVTRFGLRFRFLTIVVAIVLFAGTIAIVSSGGVPVQFLPDSGTQQLVAQVELPPGTTSERAERLLRPLERETAEQPEVLDYQVSFGAAGLSLEPDDTEQGGTLFASFGEDADVAAAVERLRRFGTREYPDGFTIAQIEAGPPTGQFEAFVTGDSAPNVWRAADRFTRYLESRGDVTEVENQDDRKQPELALDLDRDEVGTPEARSARLALTTVVPTAEVATADEDVAIAVSPPTSLIEDREALEDVPLPSETGAADAAAAAGGEAATTGVPPTAGTSGAPSTSAAAPTSEAPPASGAAPPTTEAVPSTEAAPTAASGAPPTAVAPVAPPPRTVGDFGTVERRQGAAVRTRVDGEVAATVTARLLGSDTNRINTEIQADAADLGLRGADVEISGDQEFIDQMFSDLGLAMVAAIVLVYLVLLVFFGSAGQPFTILAPILFSTIGSLLALVIAGHALGLPAMIGQLLLIGIVVANSILVVATALRQRRQRVPRDEALVRAAQLRSRPVFMTAIATIAALTPLALGISGEGGIISRSLGSVVIGGLLTATLLTLVIVPAVFTLFDRGDRPRRRLRLRRRGGGDGSGPDGASSGPDGSGAARTPGARTSA
jgi:HAE1 family hydrophobic/amphiphilic exporter-1